MRAIILAAGEGSRLRPYTNNLPKCLIEIGGQSLLLRQIEVMKSIGVHDITIVTGYCAEKINELGFSVRHNQDYNETNMVASLMCASDLLDGTDDVIIAYGDIVYEAKNIEALCNCDASLRTTVDLMWRRLWELRMDNPLDDAETLKLDANGFILELGKKPNSYDDIQGQYMGLIGVGKDKASQLVEVYESFSSDSIIDGRPYKKMFMTSFLQYLIDHGQQLKAVPVNNGWLEFDTVQDLEFYNRMYSDGSLRKYCKLDAK